MPAKRAGTLDAFFAPKPKAARLAEESSAGPGATPLAIAAEATPPVLPTHAASSLPPAQDSLLSASAPAPPPTAHPSYPFAIPALLFALQAQLAAIPASPGTPLGPAPDLDAVYYAPFVPKAAARELFHFLRTELPFYRVKYSIKRGGKEVSVSTPRFTSVFGVDDTAAFDSEGRLVGAPLAASKPSSSSTAPVPALPRSSYACTPRPIPDCLACLVRHVERATGARYNFVLVNYYASGDDSISYHSDDERFLGNEPTIASLSLGGARDFFLRHKPPDAGPGQDGAKSGKVGETVGEKEREKKAAGSKAEETTIKMALNGGDMVLMRGATQRCWLHSVPKRKNAAGRINITFRRALIRGGTENYYRYNVGGGEVYRWDETRGEMRAVSCGEGGKKP